MATTVVVAILATVASLLLEGDQGIIPIPTNQYAPIVNGTFVSSNHHSHIEVFCLQEYCVFGWMSREWVGPILLFGLWIGVVCIAGFNYAMQYIAPLVFSALGLMDPAITAILSWLIGVETLPSIFSWVGGMIVMCGVGIISYGEHQRSIKEKDHEVINSQTSNYEEVQMLGDLEDSVHGPIFDGIRNDTSIEMMELPRASDEIDNEGDHSS